MFNRVVIPFRKPKYLVTVSFNGRNISGSCSIYVAVWITYTSQFNLNNLD